MAPPRQSADAVAQPAARGVTFVGKHVRPRFSPRAGSAPFAFVESGYSNLRARIALSALNREHGTNSALVLF